jgi:AraC-like DNA-binding protein
MGPDAAPRGEAPLKQPTPAADPAPRPAAEEPPATRLVGALTAVPGLVRELGADPGAIIAAAGLDPRLLDSPSNRIAYESIVRLLDEATERTRCPHFPLLAGAAWHLSDLGQVGELIRHSPTLGLGLDEFVVHQHLNSAGAVVFLLQREGFVDFGYAIHVSLPGRAAATYSMALAAFASCLRDICGESWKPSEVLLPHAAPPDVAFHRRYFGAPLRFNAPFCALRFPAACLALPIEGADPQRLRTARAQALAAGRATIEQAASRALRTLLLHGKGSGDEVAQALAMHRRTLNRRLSAAGTTFQRVLDRVRFAVAKQLLGDTDLAIQDIAAALGYSDYVSFTRAFRRWAATSPGAWRKRPPA